MAEGVVDLLEAVEIDGVDGEPFARAQTRKRLLQPLAHQHAVRQIGQHVVARQVLDLRLRLAPLGDVLVRAYPPAAGHRHVRGRYRAAIVHLLDRVGRGIDGGGTIEQIRFRRLPAPYAECDAACDDLAPRDPRLHILGLQPIKRGVALVAHDDTLVLVVHAQALRHVRERRVEQQVARLELLLALLQDPVLALQFLFHGAPLRKVVDGVDLIARAEPLAHHADGKASAGSRAQQGFASRLDGLANEIADDALADELRTRNAAQLGDAAVGADDAAALRHHDPFGRGIGELLHDLEVAAVRAAAAHIGEDGDREDARRDGKRERPRQQPTIRRQREVGIHQRLRGSSTSSGSNSVSISRKNRARCVRSFPAPSARETRNRSPIPWAALTKFDRCAARTRSW